MSFIASFFNEPNSPDGYHIPRAAYSCSSPEAKAIYERGPPLLSKSLYCRMVPRANNFDPTDVIHFFQTSLGNRTAFWSQDFERLYNVFSEGQWEVLREDWRRMHKECVALMETFYLQCRSFYAASLSEAVLLRLGMLQEFEEVMGKLSLKADR